MRGVAGVADVRFSRREGQPQESLVFGRAAPERRQSGWRRDPPGPRDTPLPRSSFLTQSARPWTMWLRPSRVTPLPVLACLLATACGRAPEGSPAPLRIGLYAPPLTLDPHLENDFVTFTVASNVFEGLTRLDPELRVAPALASAWETPDERTWHFRVRQGVHFHEGRALRAADVVFSLERARRHPASAYKPFLSTITRVSAEADDEVVVQLADPTSVLLNRLAFVAIVPEGTPDAMRAFVGTGPYRLASHEGVGRIVLERFETYWGRPAPEPRAEYHVVPDPQRALEALVEGELDAIGSLAPRQAERLAAEACCRLVVHPSTSVEILRFRVDRPPFDDARVRRAIDLALDRDALVAKTLRGFGWPAGQLTDAGSLGHAPQLQPTRRDLPAARRLLAAAGHGGGLELELELREGRDAEELQRQLAEAGIRLVLRPLAWERLAARLKAGQVLFNYGALVADSGDAGDILDTTVHTPDAATGLGNGNFTGYSNPELDRLLGAARRAPTVEERQRVLQSAMALVMEDLPLLPLAFPDGLYGLRRELSFVPRLDERLLATEIERSR
jgi:peptide/nickel transport system substrate-binding protein